MITQKWKSSLHILALFGWVAIFMLCSALTAFAEEALPPSDRLGGSGVPLINARAAMLIEPYTGQVLYEKNADMRRYPASTTKILTLIVAMENSKMDEMVRISRQAADTEGSSFDLVAGEVLPMKEMLYGLMLPSGNDAAMAIAEHVGKGSAYRFVQMMNDKAAALGVTASHFNNPHGLPDGNHYITARDMAKIAAYGYKIPEFREFTSAQTYVADRPALGGSLGLSNHNQLLFSYPGCTGIKTGYTNAAGFCVVASAEREGIHMIALVYGSDRVWQDAADLMNYGFQTIKKKVLMETNKPVSDLKVKFGQVESMPLLPAKGISLPLLADGKTPAFQLIMDVPPQLMAPIQAGQPVGKAKIMMNDQVYTTVDLLAGISTDFAMHPKKK